MFELGSKFLSIMYETWGQISNYSDLVQGDAMYSGTGEVRIYTKCTNGAIFMGIKQTVLFIFQASCN